MGTVWPDDENYDTQIESELSFSAWERDYEDSYPEDWYDPDSGPFGYEEYTLPLEDCD